MNTNTTQNTTSTGVVGGGPGERTAMEKGAGSAAEGTGTGVGTTAGTGGIGTKIKGAYHVVHGLGENVRGTALGAIDTAAHKGGMSENDEIARRGRLEMEQGLAAFKQPKTNATSGVTPAGHAGSTATEGHGAGSATGGATTTHTGTAIGQNTDQALPTSRPTYAGDVGGAGGAGYNASPPHGDATHMHPGLATAAGAGAGIASSGQHFNSHSTDHSQPGLPHAGMEQSAGVGTTNATGGRNEGYESQNPAVDGFVHPDPSYQTGNQSGLGSTSLTSQYHPPNSQNHSGGGGVGESGYPDYNSQHASGLTGTGVHSQNPGGYGQTEKRTTENFASRATSVPHHGASHVNNDMASYQDQQAVHGGTDANPPVHHHRDDAITDLNARPGEKHGAGQFSTASDNRIPEYDRNEDFSTHQGGVGDVHGAGPGGLHQGGLGQGQLGDRGGIASDEHRDNGGRY